MSLSVTVKHGKNMLQLELEKGTTILQAMRQIEEQTGVFVRQQKLIQAGKILEASQTLEQAEIKNNAKWMLMTAAEGTQTQVRLIRRKCTLGSGGAAYKQL